MKLKENLTLQIIADTLKNKLGSSYRVNVSTHPLYRNIQWVDIIESSVIGMKIFLKNNELSYDVYVPNIAARAFVGGLFSGLLISSSKNNFKSKVSEIIIAEFYQ